MKSNTKNWLLPLLGVLIMLTGMIRHSDATSNLFSTGAIDSYNPRIEVEDSQWQEMSREQRWKVSQVPQEKLETMSTAGLLESVIEYPFAPEAYYFFESPQMGFDTVSSDFNAIQALNDRPDAGQELIHLYDQVSSQVPPHWNNTRISDHVDRLVWLEMLIAQPETLDNFTKYEMETVLKLSFLKLQEKVQVGTSVYSARSIVPTSLIAGRIMYRSSEDFRMEVDANSDLKNFLDDGNINAIDYDQVLPMYENLESYIMSISPSDPTSIKLQGLGIFSSPNVMMITFGGLMVLLSISIFLMRVSTNFAGSKEMMGGEK